MFRKTWHWLNWIGWINILCGYENGKTNLSRSVQEHYRTAPQVHTQFQPEQKSRPGSYVKQLREGREEPELSTELLRLVLERRTRDLFSASTWKMHLTMVESNDRHGHGSCAPNEVPWGSCANRSGCQPSKRVLNFQRILREAVTRPRGWQESNSTEGSGETTLSRWAVPLIQPFRRWKMRNLFSSFIKSWTTSPIAASTIDLLSHWVPAVLGALVIRVYSVTQGNYCVKKFWLCAWQHRYTPNIPSLPSIVKFCPRWNEINGNQAEKRQRMTPGTLALSYLPPLLLTHSEADWILIFFMSIA